MAGPTQGQVYDGYRFLGGDPKSEASWEQAAPVDVSAEWGPGARRLPNGVIERVGPRGGVTQIASGSGASEEGVGKLTEAQGKAVLYGGMMSGAERDYQQARQEGYDPASIRNQAARIAGAIPFDGDFAGRLIRDDVSDRGNQAELRWAEGNLRQLTGAAATNPEIARVAAINFDRGNDELSDQRYRTRSETYKGTRYTAGPGSAVLPDYPTMPGRAGEMTANGLPSVPGIAAASAGIKEIPLPPGGYGGDQPVGPGSSRETAIDYTSVPPDQLVALLANGGWIRNGDGEPYQAPAGSVRNAPTIEGDRPAAPGVYERPQDPMQGYDVALQQERANLDAATPLGGGVSMSSQTTAPFNDELAYAAGWLTQGAGNIGRRLSGRDIEVSAAARGRAAQTVYQQDQERFAKEQPVRNALGQGAGALALGSGGPSTLLTRIAGGGGVGSAFGAAQGDSWGERGRNALIGGGIGAAASPVAEKVIAPVAGRVIGGTVNALQSGARFLGRQVGNAGEALGVNGAAALVERAQPNALTQGASRFAQRSPQDVNALRGNVSRLRAEEIEPTFADAINDGGRGVLRATATRQTPARQAAREFADSRATGLQDRISTQARRTISDDPRSPLEMTAEMTAKRSREADQAFGGVRGDMISPDRGVLEALRTPAMRPAIEEAMTSALNRGDNETAALLRNLADDALEYGADAQMTVGMADRLARSLNGRAEALQRAGNNDAAAAQFALAERLRGGARGQSPGYDAALRQFADESGKIDAVALGEGFMAMEADQFAAAVARLAPEERKIAQAAARRAVERQAGTQGAAPGVAQRLSGGREQTMRSEALLGDAEPLQRAMSAEREVLRNAQAVNPSAGSQTSMNLQDAGQAAGVIGAVRAPVSTAFKAVFDRVASRGFNDAQAQAIVQAAIDPAQTDSLIEMLASAMTRREARNLARTLRYQLTTAGGQSRSTD